MAQGSASRTEGRVYAREHIALAPWAHAAFATVLALHFGFGPTTPAVAAVIASALVAPWLLLRSVHVEVEENALLLQLGPLQRVVPWGAVRAAAVEAPTRWEVIRGAFAGVMPFGVPGGARTWILVEYGEASGLRRVRFMARDPEGTARAIHRARAHERILREVARMGGVPGLVALQEVPDVVAPVQRSVESRAKTA